MPGLLVNDLPGVRRVAAIIEVRSVGSRDRGSGGAALHDVELHHPGGGVVPYTFSAECAVSHDEVLGSNVRGSYQCPPQQTPSSQGSQQPGQSKAKPMSRGMFRLKSSRRSVVPGVSGVLIFCLSVIVWRLFRHAQDRVRRGEQHKGEKLRCTCTAHAGTGALLPGGSPLAYCL